MKGNWFKVSVGEVALIEMGLPHLFFKESALTYCIYQKFYLPLYR